MNKRWFRCAAAGTRRAEVALFDDIGGFGITAQDFVAELDALGPLDALTVAINSGGGDVFDGLAIYHRLLAMPARVVVRVDGIAASIASVIAMAGNEIVMPESAWLMIHDPSALVAGGAEDMRRMAGTLDGIKNTLADIYVARTGLPKADVEAMMAAETWMDGNDAVAKGFATSLISTPAIAASLDFSKFTRVPEDVRRTLTSSANTEIPMPDNTTAPAADSPDRNAIIDELAGPVTAKADKPAKPSKADIEAAASRIADERVKAISAAYRAGRDLGLENECQRLLDDGIPAGDVPEMLISVFARRQQRNGAIGSLIPSGASVGFSNEDPKVVLDRMAEGITAQFVAGVKVSDAAQQYRGWRPQAFMRAALELRGTDTRRMQPAEIINAAMTTSDFPNLLGTSANKIFLGAYEAATGSYRFVAARRDLPNFQAQDLLRAGDFPSLAQLGEGGEITFGASSEHKETARLKTFARAISLSRQALVNDSLGAFGDLAQKAGIAAAVLENKTVWDLITTNAAISDGDAFFHANHGNLAGSGAAADATTIGAGRAAMRVQKSLDGITLNISPAVFVTSAAKETAVEQVLNPLVIPTAATNIVTPSLRSLTLVTEPLIDAAAGSNAKPWYLFANPVLSGAAVLYGGLEGNTGPRITMDAPFNVDGIQLKIVHDFYAAVADHRFAYKNPGVA